MAYVISVALPVAMMAMMFTLGLRMAPAGVLGHLRAPRVLTMGLGVQMTGLPLAAFVIGAALGLPASAMAGLMLVAASPGGVSSNYITHLAGGAVGLSVAMTLITSLAAPLTLPVVLGLAGLDGVGGSGLWRISLGMAAVALAPLAVGMGVRAIAPRGAARALALLEPLAKLGFALMVLATFVQNWGAMRLGMTATGAAIGMLAVTGPVLAFGGGRLVRATPPEVRALIVEASLQNVAVTIFVASTLLGRPELAVPGLIYAVLMNLVALALIGLGRGRQSGSRVPRSFSA